MDLSPEREVEREKYIRAYGQSNYGMPVNGPRYIDAKTQLETVYGIFWPETLSVLDVGCGRGEMMYVAKQIGFSPVHGIEIVPSLLDEGRHVTFGEITDIPHENESFDVVMCWDVLEHLVPDDTLPGLFELSRVSKRVILVSASNVASRGADGEDLHINIRPYEEWEKLFIRCFDGTVEWRAKTHISETWMCMKDEG